MDDVGSVLRNHHPLLRRRNSTSCAATLTKLSLHTPSTTSSSADEDMDLLSIKPPSSYSYTSLKDLIPTAAVNSPKPIAVLQSDSDICIRNRLVKQAAWAYLQPMSSSPGGDGEGFFRRVRPRVAAFFDCLRRGFIRVINWMIRIFPGSR